MAAIIIRDATQADVDHVATHLRAADVVELRAAGHADPAERVRQGWKAADWTKAVLVDGVPAILYGVAPTTIKGCGSPWMLATNGIYAIKQEFILGSVVEVDRMRQAYRVLINMIHHKNAVSLRWLKWLGFKINPEPTGPGGQFFIFSMGVSNV
jgi:hypothetical protein